MVGHVTQSEHMCAILIDHVFKKDNEMRKKQQEDRELRRQEQQSSLQQDQEIKKGQHEQEKNHG